MRIDRFSVHDRLNSSVKAFESQNCEPVDPRHLSRRSAYCRWVIPDPTPWADELLRVAERLQAKTKQARWTTRTDVLIERDYVVSAYAMRWLIESHLMPEAMKQHRIPLRRFDSRAQLPVAPDDAGISYDLERSRREMLPIADLCHQIVNNTVFSFYCGETGDLFDGVYLASGRNGDHAVRLVLASDYIALCADVGEAVIDAAS